MCFYFRIRFLKFLDESILFTYLFSLNRLHVSGRMGICGALDNLCSSLLGLLHIQRQRRQTFCALLVESLSGLATLNPGIIPTQKTSWILPYKLTWNPKTKNMCRGVTSFWLRDPPPFEVPCSSNGREATRRRRHADCPMSGRLSERQSRRKRQAAPVGVPEDVGRRRHPKQRLGELLAASTDGRMAPFLSFEF